MQANLELARAVAINFETFLQGLIRDELALGLALTGSQPLPERDRDRLLDRLAADNPAIRGLFWMNPDGVVIASSLRAYIGFDLADRSYFRKIVEGRDWAVSELIIGRATGKAAFTVSRAIRSENGALLGVAAASIEPDRLDSVLGLDRSASADVSLLDHKGVHVFRSPPTDDSWEQHNWLKFYPILEESLKGREIAAAVTSGLRGEQRLAAFVPVSSIGWVAVASRAESEVTAAVFQVLLPLIGLTLLLTLAAAGAAVGVSRPITRSIFTMKEHAEALGQGRMGRIVPDGPHELKILAGAVNEMAEKIRLRERALETERAQLQAVLDSLPIAVWIADEECTVIQTNHATDRIWGKTSPPYGLEKYRSYKGWFAETGEFIEPENWAIARAVRKGEISTGEVIDIERFDGTQGTILNNAAPVRDRSGRIIGGVAVAQDITEHMQVEAALRDSEKKFRTVFEQAAVGIGRVSFSDAHWIEVNDAFCQMVGYSREALAAIPWPQITHPDDVDLDLVPFRRMAAGDLESYMVEKRFIHKQGHHVWARLTLSLVRDARGKPDYEIAVIENISSQKKFEEALRRSEARWNTAIETFAEGAIIATEDEQVIYWNPAAREMHGFTRPDEGIEPLEQTPVTFQLWTPDGSHMLALDEWPMRRIKRGETIRNLELRIRRPDQGWEKIFSYSGAMVETASGERLIFLSCFDLTGLRQAEETLKASLAEKEVLLKEIHHRVKNNMQVISSLVDLQADEVQDDAVRSVLADATYRVRSMALVHEKLYQSSDLARIDFGDYAQSLVNYLWRAHGTSSVNLICDLEPIDFTVNAAVPSGLILNELFTNALKHAFDGRNGGELHVSLRAQNVGTVVLRVRDNGVGLPEGFDWQTSRSLGLTIVRMLARQLRATLEVSSDKGTEFAITMERARI